MFIMAISSYMARVVPVSYGHFSVRIERAVAAGLRAAPPDAQDMSADVFNFNAAISACEKEGQWHQAWKLPHKIREAGMTANVIRFSTAISSCEKGGQGEQGLRLGE